MKNIIINPIFRVTIFCLLLLVFSSIIGGSSFQSINVKSFKILENDLDARVNFPKRDQNGEVCAIIKVVTSATGLTFDIGSLGVVATEQKVGEVWVYVPRGAQRITISHQQLGVLRNYAFPESIKPATVYEMVLTTADVIVTIKEKEIATQWLAVSSTPSGADVFINDKFVGRTPYTGQFPEGEYSYRLELPKYHTEAGVVRLNEKKEVLSFSMRPKFGSINITSFPESGMKIYIDDNLTNLTTPATLTGISSGSHTIKLVDDWYKTQSQIVNVYDNTASTLAFTMEPAFSNVTISTNPTAEILINNLKKGTGTLKQRMLTGIYSLRAELDNHYPVERQLVIEENKDESIIINLIPKTGTLNVTSVPFDAKIILNGKYVGNTPLTIKDQLIGFCDIKLDLQGYEIYNAKHIIEEDKTTLINVELKEGTSVLIDSDPQGAKILIDNIDYGLTPFNGRISYGSHYVSIKSGKAEVKETINVKREGLNTWKYLVGIDNEGFANNIDNGIFIDSRDGLKYNWVRINKQIWMAENLKSIKYRNGDLIGTTVPDNLDILNSKQNTSPKYQWTYAAIDRYALLYGRLYTWYAAMDSRGICPIGWHLPNNEEWETLISYLGGIYVAGGKLKETGLVNWVLPNEGAENSCGFTALPSGYRSSIGFYKRVGFTGFWWSSSNGSHTYAAWAWYISYNSEQVNKNEYDKSYGFSIRCIKD